MQGLRRLEPHGIHSERCRPTTLRPHTRLPSEGSRKATGPGRGLGRRVPPPDGEGPSPERPPEGARGGVGLRALSPRAARRPERRREIRRAPPGLRLPLPSRACLGRPCCDGGGGGREWGGAAAILLPTGTGKSGPCRAGGGRRGASGEGKAPRPPPGAPRGASPGAEGALRPPAPAPAGLPRGVLGGGLQGNAGRRGTVGGPLLAAAAAVSLLGAVVRMGCAPGKGIQAQHLARGPACEPDTRRLLPAWVPAPAPQPQRRAVGPSPASPHAGSG